MPLPEYHMIVNAGTFLNCAYARAYPRHLFLAQMIAADHYYEAVVTDYCREHTDTILDNGAHEGLDFDVATYLEIAASVMPGMVVLPDLIGQHHADSRKHSMASACSLMQRLHTRCPRMMYAPQGQNEDEILQEYAWAQTELDPQIYTIGFGQSYLAFEREGLTDEEARGYLMRQVLAGQPENAQCRYHVLGARWSPENFRPLYKSYSFTGLDTIKPCTVSLNGDGVSLYPCKPQRNKLDLMDPRIADGIRLRDNVMALCSAYGLQQE